MDPPIASGYLGDEGFHVFDTRACTTYGAGHMVWYAMVSAVYLHDHEIPPEDHLRKDLITSTSKRSTVRDEPTGTKRASDVLLVRS